MDSHENHDLINDPITGGDNNHPASNPSFTSVPNSSYIDENGDTIQNGRNLRRGTFVKGNTLGKGRIKGSRNKMTQRMLDRVAERSEDGLSMEEIMMDIAQDPNMPAELRFKAAAKVSDIVYPKASAVEVKMDDKDSLTKEQIDNRLKQLLSISKGVNHATEI